MKRSIEFDLVTSSPNAFARGGASMNAVHAAKRKIKAQRSTTADVLRRLGAPPALYVPCAALGGEMASNALRVRFVRFSPGIGLDKDENLPMAFKHVKDQVAEWLGLNDRDPRIEWLYGQEKAPCGRVRVEVTDLTPGEDRVIVLASDPQGSGTYGKASKRSKASSNATVARKNVPAGDPGEERAARDLADCTTCGARVGKPCREDVTTKVFGVHEARARAAGIIRAQACAAVQRIHDKADRADRARRIVPDAQTKLARAYVQVPWEQPPCRACGGDGQREIDIPERCKPCGGRGYVEAGMKLAEEKRIDGLSPPRVWPLAVPPEHVARWGTRRDLYPRRMVAKGIGTILVFEERGSK